MANALIYQQAKCIRFNMGSCPFSKCIINAWGSAKVYQFLNV